MDAVAAGLDDEEPLPLLSVASALLSAFDDRTLVSGHNEQPLPPRDDVLQTFFDVDILETSALLAAVAGLAGDDVLRQRVRLEIADRRHVLPRWLVAMDQAEPVNIRPIMGSADDVPATVRFTEAEAWLTRTAGMTAEEATAHVAERWPHLGPWNVSFTASLDRLGR